jgi:hypothetical protein
MSLSWQPVEYVHRCFILKCTGPGCPTRRTVKARCGRRTCPECRARDYCRLRRKYGPALNAFKQPRLLTLTLRNTPNLTRETVKRLRNGMRQLWVRLGPRVRGGFYAIEPINTGRGWHVHVHVVVDSVYLPQAELVRLWQEITGDSFIVDIRTAFSPQGALKYVLKYLTKSPDVPDHLKGVYEHVLHGVRLLHPFGSLYRWIADRFVFACRRCSTTTWRLTSLWGEWPVKKDGDGLGPSPPPPGSSSGSAPGSLRMETLR